MKKRILVVILGISALTWLFSGCGEQPSDPATIEASVSAVTDTTADTAPAVVQDPESSSDAPSTQVTATPEPQARLATEDTLSGLLPEDYADALSARNQLALGTLRLAGTGDAVTVAQTQELLFYWQALKTLISDSTAAAEETAAVQDQISETMLPEQLSAIKNMALTNADLTAFYAEMGIEVTAPDATSSGTGGGSMRGLSPEEREAAKATATALGTPVGTGGGGASRRDALLDAVIEYLSS